MVYCRECGKPLEQEDKFCRYCGATAEGVLSKPVERTLTPVGESVIEGPPPPRLEAPVTVPIEKPRVEHALVRGLGRALRAIAWIVICSTVAFVLVLAIAFTSANLLGYDPPITLLLLFPVFLIAFLYKSRGLVFRARSQGDPSTTGMFVERRGEATLEGTVRNVDARNVPVSIKARRLPGLLAYSGKARTSFRLELSDPQGNQEYVQVDIFANPMRLVGSISEGDRIRVTGKWDRRSGALYAERAYNLTTKSVVGSYPVGFQVRPSWFERMSG